MDRGDYTCLNGINTSGSLPQATYCCEAYELGNENCMDECFSSQNMTQLSPYTSCSGMTSDCGFTFNHVYDQSNSEQNMVEMTNADILIDTVCVYEIVNTQDGTYDYILNGLIGTSDAFQVEVYKHTVPKQVNEFEYLGTLYEGEKL